MDGRGLIFPGEFVTSMSVAALLLYNSSPDGAVICIALKYDVIATAVLFSAMFAREVPSPWLQ